MLLAIHNSESTWEIGKRRERGENNAKKNLSFILQQCLQSCHPIDLNGSTTTQLCIRNVHRDLYLLGSTLCRWLLSVFKNDGALRISTLTLLMEL